MLNFNHHKKRQIRDSLRFSKALICFLIYVPHLIVFFTKREIITSDVRSMKREIKINLPDFWSLLYLLHNNAYFRKLFYYRIGPVATLLIGWWRPGDKYISFSQTMKLGKSVVMDHPYASVLNAESIGDNFNFRNLTTIGSNKGLRPKIGNNVTLGANVTIIGNITIGNNVFVGAGSIVVKDVPDNCIVAGNPAKIIRYLK